ncbi:glycoside hydrolase family 127 protein [Dyadobacter jiangsuensis]
MKKLSVFLGSVCLFPLAQAQQTGIINNSASPYVKHKSINMGDCQWTQGFWADKFKLAEEVMVPYMGEVLKGDVGHGLNNFKIAAGLKQGKHQGFAWHDGDFYKWMEASMYIYAQNKDKKILKELDEIIEIIGKAQEEDGYIHTKIQIDPNIDRYENRKYHEMYNSGHLFSSAVIHHRLTGQRNFLDIAIRQADLLYAVFMPDSKHYGRFGFNQTQIIGLVELYRTTKDARYLKLAEKFINNRGKYKVQDDETTKGYPIGDMVQERTPLRESNEAVGHAVLALYYYAGAADVAAETGEKALIDALDRLWDNVTDKKMYVTGAVGQAHYGRSTSKDNIEEGFIDEYMMPNMTAYNETCANITNAMFSYRMLGLHGQSKYADIIELVMFNSALSGISLGGKEYFYSNPLRMIHGSRDYAKHNTELPERQPYLECFCCPPNLVRTIAQLSGWAYSLSQKGVAVNLYGGNKLSTRLLDGTSFKLTQETQYPWEGTVRFTIEECKSAPFDIQLRIPEWARGTKIMVNGKDANAAIYPGRFAVLEREWKKGDVITLTMPMQVQLVEGNPRIEEVRNQVAVKRGPVVYCLESADLPQETSILDTYLPADQTLEARYRPDFLGGVSAINAQVMIRKESTTSMYRTIQKPQWKKVQTTLVPYFAWSNRGKSEMTVWLPVIWGK